MKKIVFKDWLEERGLLLPYIRNRLGDLDCPYGKGLVHEDHPLNWLFGAFYRSMTPEKLDFWSSVCTEWSRALDYGGAEPGMPLNDSLALALLLAELEANDGTDA